MKLLIALSSALAGLLVAIPMSLAASWDSNNSSFGGCSFGGYSETFGDSSTYDDFSQTQRPSNEFCVDLMRVYAYFCASDGVMYIRDSVWTSGISYAAITTNYWGYWSDRVYGYHRIQEPTGTYSQEITTDAFLAVTCP